MTERTVFALRGDFLYTTRPNGDLMYLGGNDTLRNYPYYSVSCDRCALTSAELRFPLGDAYILEAFPLQLRGIVFGDWATVRFSNKTGQTPQQEWAAGFGVQVWFGPLPLNFEWARTRFNPNSWDFNVRVGMSF
jgi:hemolysin activation/secretion protein